MKNLLTLTAVVATLFAATAFGQDDAFALQNADTAMVASISNAAAATGLKVMIWADSNKLLPGQNIVVRSWPLADLSEGYFTVSESFNAAPGMAPRPDSYFGANASNGYFAKMAAAQPAILLNKQTDQSRVGVSYDFSFNTILRNGIANQKPTTIHVGILGGPDSSAQIQVTSWSITTGIAGTFLQAVGKFPTAALFAFVGLPPYYGAASAPMSTDGRHLSVPIQSSFGAPADQVLVLMTNDGSTSVTIPFHLAQ